jgi:hypothetical protein
MAMAQEHDHPAHDRLVEIVVNNRPVSVPQTTTGGEIKRLAGLSSEFNLFAIKGDHEIAVGNDEEIKVHKGQRFLACPGLEPA